MTIIRLSDHLSFRIMSIHPTDIRSLSDFLRNHRAHLERLADTGRPEVLTVNGRARVVVQDAEAYQRLVELADRMEGILALREALDSVQRGEGVPLEELDRAMRARHGLADRPGATGTEGR